MHNFVLVNCDTDALAFCKPNGENFLPEEQTFLLNELNAMFPEAIKFDPDGYFDKFIVLKSKNYIMRSGEKVKIKGSAVTDNKKELALREFINECIQCFLDDRQQMIFSIYHKYVKEANQIIDINRWTVKKTITKPVLTNERTNEKKIRNAIGDQVVSEGDKLWLYSAIDGEIQDVAKGEPLFYADGRPKMVPNRILKKPLEWTGDQDVEHYIERVYKTLCIFENLINIKDYPNFALKRNKKLLKELINAF